MKARCFALMLGLMFFCRVGAQQTSGLYLSLNPLCLAESQAVYGVGLGYFNPRWEICSEIGQLNPPMWGSDRYVQIQGFRTVSRFKYFFNVDEMKQSKTFFGAEFRSKNYAFDDIADFVSRTTGATIKDYVFRNTTTVKAYAALFGKQFEMGEMGRWVIEFTAGLGVRMKHQERDNTPPNSYIVPVKLGFGETPNYADNYTSVHVPLGIRIMVKL